MSCPAHQRVLVQELALAWGPRPGDRSGCRTVESRDSGARQWRLWGRRAVAQPGSVPPPPSGRHSCTHTRARAKLRGCVPAAAGARAWPACAQGRAALPPSRERKSRGVEPACVAHHPRPRAALPLSTAELPGCGARLQGALPVGARPGVPLASSPRKAKLRRKLCPGLTRSHSGEGGSDTRRLQASAHCPPAGRRHWRSRVHPSVPRRTWCATGTVRERQSALSRTGLGRPGSAPGWFSTGQGAPSSKRAALQRRVWGGTVTQATRSCA